MPYLNSAPFFRGLALGAPYDIADCVPRELGARAASGALLAGLLPVVDAFRLEETFERLGPFGIAVHGRAHSVLLFSRVPLRQLEGAAIAVTQDTSTSAVLLRLILEQRYKLSGVTYRQGTGADAEAMLLIGDEALRVQSSNTRYPYETDIAFEWWLWQHLPFTFAVWAIRKDADAQQKRALELALSGALGKNLNQLEAIAQEHAPRLGLPVPALTRYLTTFHYRLSRPEDEGIQRFRELTST